jgi:hypothetical protein
MKLSPLLPALEWKTSSVFATALLTLRIAPANDSSVPPAGAGKGCLLGADSDMDEKISRNNRGEDSLGGGLRGDGDGSRGAL